MKWKQEKKKASDIRSLFLASEPSHTKRIFKWGKNSKSMEKLTGTNHTCTIKLVFTYPKELYSVEWTVVIIREVYTGTPILNQLWHCFHLFTSYVATQIRWGILSGASFLACWTTLINLHKSQSVSLTFLWEKKPSEHLIRQVFIIQSVCTGFSIWLLN